MTLSTPNETRGDRRAPLRPWIAVALLATTVALGAAARHATGKGPGPFEPPVPDPWLASASAGPVRFEARLDRGSVLRGSDGAVRMELVIRGDDRPCCEGTSRVPTDLVVVLDRSGSMQGAPISTAKAAVHELVARLGPDDRFALVTYANGAELPLPLATIATADAARVARLVDSIGAGGGTNLSSGLDLAVGIAERAASRGRVARVVVLSDGHANQGDASPEGLRARAARVVASEAVLSSVGIGASFDEALMSALADAGTGNFYYLPDAREVEGVFADEFASARETLASALTVGIEPRAGARVVDAAGYPLERDGAAAVRFRPGSLFAGQERRIWVELHAPTDALGTREVARVSLAYTDRDGERHRIALPQPARVACVGNADDYFAAVDKEAWRRGSQVQAVNALKVRVAEALRDGRREDAAAEVDGFRQRYEAEQLRSLGYVDSSAMAPLRSLGDAVAEPAAATPEGQNALAKKLLEEGRDGLRPGSKRK